MSTSVGNDAEEVASQYLKNLGYKILERNWKTRVCEIDIIAKKDNCIYFVEVKYRSTPLQGGGLDYITTKKLTQMKFAAQCWVQEHKYNGAFDISAIEVSADFTVTEFIRSID